MSKVFTSIKYTIMGLLLAGCAGMQKDCSSCNAESFGADWIITQNALDGQPFNCWQLKNLSVSNETHSDGIYFQLASGSLISISGSYTKVQVKGGDFKRAAQEIGIDLDHCTGGKYQR